MGISNMINFYIKNIFADLKIKMLLCFFVFPFFLKAQNNADSILANATLENVVHYALVHQPLIQQSLLDEKITESEIKSKLADWYPQVNFGYSYQHNFLLQTAVFAGNTVKLGVNNTSAFQFTATQNIFNRDVLLATRSKDDVRLQVKQITTENKIDVAASVSKAFYDLLATMQQIKVADETIARLERSLKDAYAHYTAGIADKTDYKRATIALNNAKASKMGFVENIKAKKEYLETLMGYPSQSDITIVYDSLQMEREVTADTIAVVDYTKRIEFQLLSTQKKLQQANLQYNKWSYLPTVSAYGAYNFNFQNDALTKLYSKNFPNSYAGLTIAVPIFQGGKRKYNIQQQQFQLQRIDLDILNLEHNINDQYVQAMALYKSYLANFNALKENVTLAQEVYDVLNLQYKAGIKTYLEVISAETDLNTAKINYYNALYQLLSAKIDLQKALGQINY